MKAFIILILTIIFLVVVSHVITNSLFMITNAEDLRREAFKEPSRVGYFMKRIAAWCSIIGAILIPFTVMAVYAILIILVRGE